MTTRMLIDARHPEETRVAVAKGQRIEEFDFESAEHRQLKGNIYLAKVTRVEPSLQAAFVDFGGNRHGFLAFSEIHPDYYQIPKEDRDALLREEAEQAAEEARLRDAAGDLEPIDGHHDDDGSDDRPDADLEDDADEAGGDGDGGDAREAGGANGHDDEAAARALRARRMALRRRYRIQDVIHRRQVLLVQVVKEERGNKGAALTTYLSLAGRYCVLMPNTTHGGGISRKISNATDRKRLKSILSELKLPDTMGCIVRTAGLQRTKAEIKRDFDYLARLWDEIRETTLKSTAPKLIYKDSDLIKRAIRDIYNRDIEEVIVEGEEGYKQARDFMKLLMPSHVRRVKAYADPVPLFQRYGVEDQLEAMYQPVVTLKSGGYLVINPTEALVSIDINSGRATREHGIEATAVNTNLEAAQEIARQLRLRDMAGLVVIDFIDMEHHSNVRKVERAMRTALANDRARIQVGRISQFGLLEMSRQRLRTGVLEASTRTCPHCEGTGLVRTASSSALSALRLLEEEAARGQGSRIALRASQEAAIYVLNRKRDQLRDIEERYGVSIDIVPNGAEEGASMEVQSSGPPPVKKVSVAPILIEEEEDDLPPFEDEAEFEEEARDAGEQRRKPRRRRGRKGQRGGEASDTLDEAPDAEDGETAEAKSQGAREDREERQGRRRRGRRGGRNRKRGGPAETRADEAQVLPEDGTPDAVPEAEPAAPAEAEAPAKPKRSRKKAPKTAEPEEAAAVPAEASPAPEPAEAEAKAPKRRTRKSAKADDKPLEAVGADTASSEEPGGDGSPRRGWWQRTFGADA